MTFIRVGIRDDVARIPQKLCDDISLMSVIDPPAIIKAEDSQRVIYLSFAREVLHMPIVGEIVFIGPHKFVVVRVFHDWTMISSTVTTIILNYLESK